jgi:hypothetical protein
MSFRCPPWQRTLRRQAESLTYLPDREPFVMRSTFSFAVLAAVAVSLAMGLEAAPAAAAKSPSTKTAVPAKLETPAAVAKSVDAQLVNEVPALASASIAPRTSDAVFARRVYLDLVGEWPTAAELTAFSLDPSPNKREKLVERLLADPRFGLNWGRYWRDVVLYRRAEDRALITAAAATTFFAERLNADTPWNEIVGELITATGNLAEVGQTILVAAQMGDANEIASEVSRIFCGVQISCAQCHDHPTDRWKRQQFHELAAFFPRVAVRPVLTDGMVRGFEAVSRDFGPRGFFLQNIANNPRFRPIEHFMPDLKDPSSQGTLMQPVFFATGTKLEDNAKDIDRRQALADALSSKENPWFAKAFVNRIWSELVGEGFYPGVDDLGPDRPCQAPETLDRLAADFTASGYDIKRVFRVMLATEAYGRESRPRRNPDDAPFTANCVQRLRGDQLFDAISNALGMPSTTALPQQGYAGLRMQFASPRAQFNTAFGFDPSAHRDEVTGSIPQALLIMNNPGIAEGFNGSNTKTALGKLLATETDNETVAVELYLRCLAREPNDRELKVCLDHVKETGDRVAAFEDVLWSIVNSTELLYRQ